MSGDTKSFYYGYPRFEIHPCSSVFLSSFNAKKVTHSDLDSTANVDTLESPDIDAIGHSSGVMCDVDMSG